MICCFFLKHFFTGQLILHEAKRLVGAARGAGAGTSSCSLAHSTPSCLLTGESAHVTTSLAAAQAAVMMPSPAEQVTDDLISPKYDEEDEEEEEVGQRAVQISGCEIELYTVMVHFVLFFPFPSPCHHHAGGGQR